MINIIIMKKLGLLSLYGQMYKLSVYNTTYPKAF